MDYTKDDTITLDLSGITDSSAFGSYDINYGAIPPNVTIASGTYTTAALSPDIFISDSVMNVAPSGTLTLRGEDADIDINGVSLMETLRGIQERLNILQPNRELEAEWDQLRELGEQYRRLEQELAEKSRAWKALKS